MIKTPSGPVPDGTPMTRIVHEFTRGKTVYRSVPDPPGRCPGCGELATGHEVNDDIWCCECYVRKYNCPADWHPECMRVYSELHPETRHPQDKAKP